MDKQLTVAYVRLSREDLVKENEYSNSIYNQLELIKSYAKARGLFIDKEYIDDGYSGINFERPAFEKLKEDIDMGLIRIVITKDISRLGRNFLETAYYISQYFPENNIRYIAINDQLDSNNITDTSQQIMLDIRSFINDRYVKDISVKRRQVARMKTEEGQYIGAIAPYGYKIKKIKDKRTLEIDKEAARIVKRIFIEIAEGKTRKEVAEGLNNDKIISPIVYMNMTPSKNKKYYYDWSDKIIYKILKNKTYTGRIVKRKSLKADYHQKKRKGIPISERETIDSCHPVIISDELFNIANSRLKTIKKREKNSYRGLFNGLVICGVCGKIMKPCRIQKKDRVQYYFECTRVVARKRCKSRMIADSKLEIIVIKKLKDIINYYLDEEKIITRVVKDLIKEERPNLKINNLKDNLQLCNTNIRNLYLKKTTGDITLTEFIKRKEKQIKLKEHTEKLLKEIIQTKNKEIRKKQLLEKYHEFLSNNLWIGDNIKDLIKHIVIYKDKTIKLSFKFSII